MSPYELLSVVLASLAMLLSLYVWSGQRRLQREALELQKFTADLDRRQLQLLNQQELDKKVAKLSLVFERVGRNESLIVRNVGSSDALAVDIRPVDPPLEESFVIESEFADKLPIRRLRAGEQISLLAAVAGAMPPNHTFHVTWKNSDGSTSMDDFTVVL